MTTHKWSDIKRSKDDPKRSERVSSQVEALTKNAGGAVHICEECLTLRDTMSVCCPGEPCRRCGHVPDPQALTVSDIRAIVRRKREASK